MWFTQQKRKPRLRVPDDSEYRIKKCLTLKKVAILPELSSKMLRKSRKKQELLSHMEADIEFGSNIF